MLNSCLPLKRFWTVRNDENMGQQPDASEAGTAPGLEVDDHSFQWFLVGDRGIYLSDNPEVLSKDNLKVISEIGLLNTLSVVGWKYVDGAEVRSGATTEINSLRLENCQLTDIGLSEFRI